jgi:PTS system mannose-specific IIA component
VFGIIIASHGMIGTALVDTAANIFPCATKVCVFTIDWDAAWDDVKKNMAREIDSMKQSGDILIMTDMFGGTPNNVAMTFYERERVEVISGINLPLLLKALVGSTQHRSVSEMAKELKKEAERTIVVAGSILGDQA